MLKLFAALSLMLKRFT